MLNAQENGTIDERLDALVRRQRPGFSLDRELYTADWVFKLDLQRIFARNWLMAGHSCEIPNPGDYFLFQIGDDSLIVIRGDDGRVNALYNTCRHRGSIICEQESGHAGKLVCPYHQWVFDRDGSLRAARHMSADFCKEHYALQKAHCRELGGLIFICGAADAPDFETPARIIAPQLKPHGLEQAKIAFFADYKIEANWKVIFENNRECYHCATKHPQYCATNFDLGTPGDDRTNDAYDAACAEKQRHWRDIGVPVDPVSFPGESWYRCDRVALQPGCVSETIDGQPAVQKLMGDFTERDMGSFRLITLPNFWSQASGDYWMSMSLSPLAPQLTRARVWWLVHKDAKEGVDYDVNRLTEVWKATNEQDWKLSVDNQRGINSSRYTPGPYSTLAERGVDRFDRWYLRQISSADVAVPDVEKARH